MCKKNISLKKYEVNNEKQNWMGQNLKKHFHFLKQVTKIKGKKNVEC